MSLLPVFDIYPKHGEVVGRLLAGYSELEIDLMYAVMAVRGSLDDIFKAMYRTRGERQRIFVADALARGGFDAIGLSIQYNDAINAMQHCRKIRNQFAHCQWYSDSSGYLKFTALEDVAMEKKKLQDFSSLTIRRLDLVLLQSQMTYFECVQSLLMWLKWEALCKLKSVMNPHAFPKLPARPDLYTP
jgi:hypothetical protein